MNLNATIDSDVSFDTALVGDTTSANIVQKLTGDENDKVEQDNKQKKSESDKVKEKEQR